MEKPINTNGFSDSITYGPNSSAQAHRLPSPSGDFTERAINKIRTDFIGSYPVIDDFLPKMPQSGRENQCTDAVSSSPDVYYNGTGALDSMLEEFGTEAVIFFCRVNAHKYKLRAGKKEGNTAESDLKKAVWYLETAVRLQGARREDIRKELHLRRASDNL